MSPAGPGGVSTVDALRSATARPKALFVEPDVFHAPAVVDAVDHDRQPLDIGLLAGRAARIEDDRPCRILRQFLFDLAYQLLPLFRIRLHRLLVNQLVNLRTAKAGIVA